MSSNSQKLLKEIVDSENPVKLLDEMFDSATDEQEEELCGILRELKQEGFISIMWADNRPYHIIINNVARMYEGQLAEYEVSKNKLNRKTNYWKQQGCKFNDCWHYSGNSEKKTVFTKTSRYLFNPNFFSYRPCIIFHFIQIVHFIEGLF